MERAQRVIGIGSPHGDDQAAWQLVERLRNRPGFNAGLIALSDPSHLLDSIGDCDRLIIVDACTSGGPPGTVTRLTWPDARIETRHCGSTHGMGVAYALRLAEQLGRLPPEVVLFGIELSQSEPGASLSGAVEASLREVEMKILLEVENQRQGGVRVADTS